jgi:Relaxase/Mobilisation nuclease domain
MIIKALSRKAGGGQLIRYILRYALDDEKQTVSKDQPAQSFIIRHNIRSRSIEGFIKEFKQNEANRIHKRSNQTVLNHFIISFSPGDSKNIDDETLKAIAKKFIQLRGENNLYVGSKHLDKEHIHLHIAGSGTQINGLSSRISKKELADLKLELDVYQKEQFPELFHSLPQHGFLIKQKDPLKRIKSIGQDKHQTQRKGVLKDLEATYSKSVSLDAFLSELKVLGHEPYYRAGKLAGIKYQGQRKFRLAKLGFEAEKLEQLNIPKDKESLELVALQQLRKGSKEKELAKEHEGWIRERTMDEEVGKTPSPFSTENEGYGEVLPIRRISISNMVSPV